VSDAKPVEPQGARDLFDVARAFGLIAWGVFLWIALRSGAVEIPLLANRLPAPSALPGLLWAFAAYRLWRVRDLTPGWNSAARRLLIAAALHVYLIPYLGWWHAATPAAYQRINTALLAAAIAIGLTAAYRLAFEAAARIQDRMLRAELWLSVAAMPALAAAFALLLRWSATRAGAGEATIVEWFVLLREIPGGPRIALMLILLMPMLPFAMIMLEARARVLAWLSRRAGEEFSGRTP
jgi:hypothetical protein